MPCRIPTTYNYPELLSSPTNIDVRRERAINADDLALEILSSNIIEKDFQLKTAKIEILFKIGQTIPYQYPVGFSLRATFLEDITSPPTVTNLNFVGNNIGVVYQNASGEGTTGYDKITKTVRMDSLNAIPAENDDAPLAVFDRMGIIKIETYYDENDLDAYWELVTTPVGGRNAGGITNLGSSTLTRNEYELVDFTKYRYFAGVGAVVLNPSFLTHDIVWWPNVCCTEELPPEQEVPTTTPIPELEEPCAQVLIQTPETNYSVLDNSRSEWEALLQFAGVLTDSESGFGFGQIDIGTPDIQVEIPTDALVNYEGYTTEILLL